MTQVKGKLKSVSGESSRDNVCSLTLALIAFEEMKREELFFGKIDTIIETLNS